MASDRAKRNVLLASALGSSLAPFMVSALIVALPTIGREFSADVTSLGLLTSTFFIAAAIFLVPFGKVADTYGVKKVFTLGVAVYFIAALLCVFSPDLSILTLARALTGIGAAMIFGTSIALVSLVFPESERGKAIGINVAAMSLGFLMGFLLGGILTFYSGWRTLFLLTLPVEILVFWLVVTRLKGECELLRRREPDIPGMVVYGLAILFIMTGTSLLPQRTGSAILGAGILCLPVLALWELRVGSPLIELRALAKNRQYLIANLVVIIFNTTNFAVIFLASLFLQDIKGYDPRFAGLILLATVVFMVLLSPVAGKLSDRTHPAYVIGSGIILSSAGLGIFAFVDTITSFPVIIIALSLVGAGIAFSQSPLVRTAVSSVPREMYGFAAGMIETMRLLGMTISISIAGIVFALTTGGLPGITPRVPTFIEAFHTSFRLYLAISLIVLILVMTLHRYVLPEKPGKVPEKGN